MTNVFSAKKILLSGVSLLSLAAVGSLPAIAGNITITGGSTPAVTVTTAQTFDFVLIESGATVAGDVSNSGTIGVSPRALAIDHSTVGGGVRNLAVASSFTGVISATRVGIAASSASIASGIDNQGSIAVNAPGSFSSSRVIAGIAVGGSAVSTTISNSGNIHVAASGSGVQPNFSNSSAVVIGIGVRGTTQADATITNSGMIEVVASRSGSTFTYSSSSSSSSNYTGTVAKASAIGIGIGEITGGGSHGASITNSGTVRVSAIATVSTNDSSLDTARATARAAGIVAGLSSNSGSVTVDLVNSGMIKVTAHAVAACASCSDEPTEVARAQVFGIAMSATADGSASSIAKSSITNDGSISLMGSAAASGSSPEYATAYATVTGIRQSATNANTATAELTNSATHSISMTAVAKVTVSDDNPSAYANIYGISQSATATGAAGSMATATLTNGGSITMLAQATVNGGDESGSTARAQVSNGIYQTARSAEKVAAVLTNSAGAQIDLRAIAHATDRSGNSAHAFAYVSSGVSQSARANTGGLTASALLTNDGDVTMTASAFGFVSHTTSSASGKAHIDNGIYQRARDAGAVSADIVNNGTISLQAKGYGATTGGYASRIAAYGYVTRGVAQYATADGVLGSSASVGLTNSASKLIDIGAFASASQSGSGRAYAYASVDTGVRQIAKSANQASATLSNDGTLNIHATALARYSRTSDYDATAQAKVATGVFQSAQADGSPGSNAAALLTNTSSTSLDITAKASATDSYSTASARATVSSGIFQGASHGITNTATLNNSGAINIHASAYAKGSYSASASARISNGIYQSASGIGTGSSATAALTNSGGASIDIAAKATAIAGRGTASASASISQGIHQYAQNGDTVSVSLTNTGNSSITMSAVAKAFAPDDTATASASIAFGIYQQASATGAAGSMSSATLTNDTGSSITMSATATASVATDSYVTASATIRSGIYQNVSGAETNTARLTNSGNINMSALAKAISNSSSSADALAKITRGIDQSAVGAGPGSSASAILTNDPGALIVMRATATAIITSDTSAQATARATHAVMQYAQSAQNVSASLTNSGGIRVLLHAFASATDSSSATAQATMSGGIYQYASSLSGSGSSATVGLTNNSDITLLADASAFARRYDSARATARVNPGISQQASGALDAGVSLTNSSSGMIDIAATALAKGFLTEGRAKATVSNGIYQSASGDGTPGGSSAATLTNDGTITFLAKATGTATDERGYGRAKLRSGIYQYAGNATDASVTFLNSNTGTLSMDASAKATGTSWDRAQASLVNGFRQEAYGDGTPNSRATVDITNSGNMTFSADATARGGSGVNATGRAKIDAAVWQSASGGNTASLATFTNSNNASLDVTARADVKAAASTIGATTAFAYVTPAIYQYVNQDGASSSAVVDNSGSITIQADAQAVAPVKAAATAVVAVASQIAKNGTVTMATFTNSGSVAADATASVEAFDAHARAGAGGVVQKVGLGVGDTGTASFTNDAGATFAIAAHATARGRYGSATTATVAATASASAGGVAQSFTGGDAATKPTANMMFSNSGTMSVHALASATAAAATSAPSSAANAFAAGYFASSNVGKFTNVLNVVNSGTMNISATAQVTGTGLVAAVAIGMQFEADNLSGTFLNSGTLMVKADPPVGHAQAIGVQISSDAVTASLRNTGVISAIASGTSGALLGATGVKIGEFFGGGTQTATFTNDGGTINAWINTPTPMRANAFETESAGYPVRIALQGSAQAGHINGNIDIGANDMIEVTNGTTFFDGVINPDGINEGALGISGGGKFELVDNQTALGAANGRVDTLSVQSGGTLGYQIDAAGGAGWLNANTASLDGTIAVTALAGAYGVTQTYTNVIAANTSLSGTFATEVMNTPLLDLTVRYQPDKTVDLIVTRNAFTSVTGLTPNQNSVGAGIESTYSTASGTYAGLVNQLFTLDTAGYRAALDQLSGVEYAGALQAALNSSGLYRFAIGNRLGTPLGVGVSRNNSVVTSSNRGRASATGVWMSIQGSNGTMDRDGNASGYSYSGSNIVVGIDGQTGQGLVFGAAIGAYNPGNLSFDNGNSVRQGNGYQIGGYAQYEASSYYARGSFSFGNWDADATRTITVGSLSGINRSSFNVDAWNLHGEFGYALRKTASYALTPFAGFDYSNASIGNVTETGFTASGLKLNGSSDKFDALLGVRVQGQYQSGNMLITPSASIAFKQNLSSKVTANGAFASGPSGTGFSVAAPDQSSSVVLDLGTTITNNSRMSFSVGYKGEFGSKIQQNSAFAKISFRF